MEDTVKTSLTLTKEELKALEELAKEHGVSVAEMLRTAISEEAFLVNAVEDGSRVLLEDEDKTLKELVLR
jgi:hypothetical protein